MQSAEANIIARQFRCPPGDHCGPGPVCATIFCHLPGCVDAPACQNVTITSKRSPKATVANRQLDCPPGIACGPGPECTAELCDLPGCVDADVCQGDQDKKRSADTDIVHPICDICEVNADGVKVCGCATADGGSKRRATERVCPLFCITTEDGDELCGCAAEDYENSSNGGKSKV